MIRLFTIAVLLVVIPIAVLSRQYWTTYRDDGALADYIDVDEPPELDPTHPDLSRGGIPVLCYHYLRGRPTPLFFVRVLGAVVFNLPTVESREYWSITSQRFEEQMAWLHDNGFTPLTVSEVSECLRGERKVPPRPICITFDDGDRSVLTRALPILERYDMRASLFVVASTAGERWKGVRSMSWDELAQIQASGRFEIGSHTHDMHYKVKSDGGGILPVFLNEVPDAGETDEDARQRVFRDLALSRRLLRAKLKVPCDYLAWPYGFANDELDQLAEAAGYAGTFGLGPRANVIDFDDPWQMPRFLISARTTLRDLEQVLQRVHDESNFAEVSVD